jgi:hypothetical protein
LIPSFPNAEIHSLQISAAQQNLKQLVEESRSQSIVCDFSIQSKSASESAELQPDFSVETTLHAASPIGEDVMTSASVVPDTHCVLGHMG